MEQPKQFSLQIAAQDILFNSYPSLQAVHKVGDEQELQ
jgi:hypothetical protein